MFIILSKSPAATEKGAAGASNADNFKVKQREEIGERIATLVQTESTKSIMLYWGRAPKRKRRQLQ